MMDRFFEWMASKSNHRFKAYRQARLAYESYLSELRVSFDEMTEKDYQHARDDVRLKGAESGYLRAIELCRMEKALPDLATALYQLGMLLHMQGKLNEARIFFKEALVLMQGMIQVDRSRSETISGCLYHLGVIALKQGNYRLAIKRLRSSLEIDTENSDFSGMAMNRKALEKCPSDILNEPEDENHGERQEDGELEDYQQTGIDSSVPGANKFEDRASTNDGEFTETVDSAGFDSASEKQSSIAEPEITDRTDVIWLFSFSREANDRVMELLDSIKSEFPRNTRCTSLILEDVDGQMVTPEPIPRNARLCAAVLVVEPAALDNEAFRYWANWCMLTVAGRDDFRLFVNLKGISLEELRRRADQDSLVANLFDTVQIAESPSAEQLRRHLVPYLRRWDFLRSAYRWRLFYLWSSQKLGGLAAVVQLLCGFFLALAVFIRFMTGTDAGIWQRAAEYRLLIAMVIAIPLFPLYIIPLFLLFQGFADINRILQENHRLVWWFFIGVALSPGTIGISQQLGAPAGWIALGVALGIVLDIIRRRGYQSRRARVHLEKVFETTEWEFDPALVAAPPLNPFYLPMFSAAMPKLFISYSRSSRWSDIVSWRIHNAAAAEGADSFHDRSSIGVGAGWRRVLNQRISDTDIFTVLVDDATVHRHWVAAELITALLNRKITGSPEIIILKKPDLTAAQISLGLPVFQAVFADSEVISKNKGPRIISAEEKTIDTVTAGLSPGSYKTRSIFPPRIASLFYLLTIPPLTLGTLCVLPGWLALILGILQNWHKFDSAGLLESQGLLPTVVLLVAFWLGTAARLGIAAQSEMSSPDWKGGSWAHLIAALGFALLLHNWAGQVGSLTIGWAVFLALSGWLLNSVFIGRIKPQR